MNTAAEKMFAPQLATANTIVRVGVGVIIVDEQGRILLEQRSDCGLWGLPGGRIEPGESITQAALREVTEETGLTVTITQLLGIYSEPSERTVAYPDNVVQLVDVVLLAIPVSGQLQCSAESLALEFFAPANLPVDIVPPAESPLQDFLRGRRGIIH